MTILVLVCFLVAGAAAASILGRDSVPSVWSENLPAAAKAPSANRESKKDKLPLAMAALPPAADNPQALPEPLRQAFASDSPFSPQPPKIAAPSSMPLPADKPKAAAKPPVQKSYALLSDIQIAGIKERLKLSPAQEQHWPGVESALRAVARKIHATRQANPAATGAPIDPDSAEVSQLKSAAMPLLIQLREDQKREVRMLARIIGLEAVASQI
jgi:ABC-type transporter Mla MlaB component